MYVCVCLRVCCQTVALYLSFTDAWEKQDVDILVLWHNLISAVTQKLAVVQTAGEEEQKQLKKDRNTMMGYQRKTEGGVVDTLNGNVSAWVL